MSEARVWEAAWPEGATGRGVRVAVVDSGWEPAHPEPRVAAGLDVGGLPGAPGPDVRDRFGHGTACADLVLRAAPGAEVVPVRVFRERLETSPRVLAAAIRHAVDAGCAVLNLSLGTCEPAGVRALYAACEYARRRGAVVVAAAHEAGAESAPALFDNVLAVGRLPGNSGLDVVFRPGEAVDCLAHGAHLGVRWLAGERAVVHGTSYAAPVVAAAVARIRERHPGAGLDAVRRLLGEAPLPVAAGG